MNVQFVFIGFLGLFGAIDLSVLVYYRIKRNVFVGDGDDPALKAAIDRLDRFTKQVPVAIALIVLAMIIGVDDGYIVAATSLIFVGQPLQSMQFVPNVTPKIFLIAGQTLSVIGIATISLGIIFHSWI